MKKALALILLAAMIFTMAACGAAPAAPAEQPAAQEPAAPAEEAPAAEAPAEEPAAAAEYTIGMGVVVSTDSSKENNAQVDATVAAVVLDAEGKIVACQIDCAQSKMDVTGGAVDAEKTFKSKVELGDDYNMVKFGNAIAEWYAQADAFEAYVTGMTAADVAAIEMVENGEHMVAVDEALLAGCTMSIADFVEAVSKACEDTWAQTFTADSFTLGVAAITTAESSTAATAEADGSVQMYTDFAAAAVDADGVILATVTDAIQPKIAIDVNGAIVECKFDGTKRELGENYNMVKFGSAIAEWDAQADAFAKFCAGKTAAEVEALEVADKGDGEHFVTTDETLLASCTMSIVPLQAIVAKAANNA